jgi:TPR repeat protein
MYASGRGVALDLAQAARWYQHAAEQGLAEAQFNLGTLYGTGRGVPRDEALAATWLERATLVQPESGEDQAPERVRKSDGEVSRVDIVARKGRVSG